MTNPKDIDRAREILAAHGCVDGFNLPVLPGYTVSVDPGAALSAVAAALAQHATKLSEERAAMTELLATIDCHEAKRRACLPGGTKAFHSREIEFARSKLVGMVRKSLTFATETPHPDQQGSGVTGEAEG